MIPPSLRVRSAAVLAVMLPALFLSGCWHQIPLEKRGLVPAIAIDLSPSGGYEVTAAIIFPVGLPSPGPSGQGGASGAVPLFLRSASAPSVMQAIHDLTPSAYLHLDFTHLQEVILSEAVARAGMAPALEYLARSLEFAQAGWLLVARGGTASSILRDTDSDLPQPNEVLSETVRWSQLNTPYHTERLFTAFKEMPLAGMEFATAGVTTGKSQDSETVPVVLSGEALFRGDRLVGWLQGDPAVGWAAVMKRLHHQALSVLTPTGRVELELAGAGRRVRVIPDGMSVPQVQISLRVAAHLADVSGTGDFWGYPGRVPVMETVAAQALQREVRAALEQAQSDGTDVFGIGEYVRLRDPAYWYRVRTDWNTGAFPNLPVSVMVRVTITSVGEILCPLLGRC